MDVKVVQIRKHPDSFIVVGRRSAKYIRCVKHQGKCDTADVISVDKDTARVGEYRVQIAWANLEHMSQCGDQRRFSTSTFPR